MRDEYLPSSKCKICKKFENVKVNLRELEKKVARGELKSIESVNPDWNVAHTIEDDDLLYIKPREANGSYYKIFVKNRDYARKVM